MATLEEIQAFANENGISEPAPVSAFDPAAFGGVKEVAPVTAQAPTGFDPAAFGGVKDTPVPEAAPIEKIKSADELAGKSYEELVAIANDPNQDLKIKEGIQNSIYQAENPFAGSKIASLFGLNSGANNDVYGIIAPTLEKYKSENPDKKLYDPNGDGNIIESPNAQATKDSISTTLNAVVGGFGDEALSALGATDAAASVRKSRDAAYERSLLAAFGSEAIGSIIPSAAILKGAGALGLGVRATATGAAALEGAVTGAGYANEGEKLGGAVVGGLVGGALGAIAPSIVNGVTNKAKSIFRNFGAGGADIKAAEKLTRKISSFTGKMFEAKDIAEALANGKSLPQYLVENGVPEKNIVTLIEDLGTGSIGDTAKVNAAASSAINRSQDAAIAARKVGIEAIDDAVATTGAQVGAARAAGSADDVSEVIRRSLQGDDSRIVAKSIKPVALEWLNTKGSDIAEKAGYALDDVPRLQIEKSTGHIYVIDKTAVADASGKFDPKNLRRIEPDASFLQSVDVKLKEQSISNFTKGPTADRPYGKAIAETGKGMIDDAHKIVPNLETADAAATKAFSEQDFVKKADQVLGKGKGGSISPDDITELDNLAKSKGVSNSADRLRLMQVAIDKVKSSGRSSISLLESDSKHIKALVRDTLSSNGMDDAGITAFQNSLGEISALNKLSGGKVKIESKKMFDRLVRGFTDRWYFGVTSAAYHSILAEGSFWARKGFGKIINSPAKQAKVTKFITDMVDNNSPEFQRIMGEVAKSNTPLTDSTQKLASFAIASLGEKILTDK